MQKLSKHTQTNIHLMWKYCIYFKTNLSAIFFVDIEITSSNIKISINLYFLLSVKYCQPPLESTSSYFSSKYTVPVIFVFQTPRKHQGMLSHLPTKPDSMPRKYTLHSFWGNIFSSLAIGGFLKIFFLLPTWSLLVEESGD